MCPTASGVSWPVRQNSAAVIRLSGPILTGLDSQRSQAWIIGGRITFERPRAAGSQQSTISGWVLPGLVDAHCHIGLAEHGAVTDAQARIQAETDRDAGTLLIRDAGSPADTRWIQQAPDLPQLIRAGRHIARTKRYLRNYAHEVEPEFLVEQVQLEARRGDGWVKIVADWIDRTTGDLAPCWPASALTAAVAAAHAEGARITAHCFGAEALPDLLAAGIDGIEHGCGLAGQTIELAAAAQVAVVPTLVNIATFPQLADRGFAKFPKWSAHIRDLHARRFQTVGAAAEAGVPIFAGTDAGGTLPHGLIAAEVAELVRAGLTPIAALNSATWAAREWLGRPALVEGASADVVVYPADPRQEVGVLAHPRAVILRGVRYC